MINTQTDLPSTSTTAAAEPASAPRPKITVGTFFSRKWIISTVLVLAAMAVMVRLGKWQLDRLEQRQTRNAFISQQLAQPPLLLNTAADLPAGKTTDLKLRRVSSQGVYDFDHQIALKSQNWEGMPGVHLITPLVIGNGNEAVLVDRGWIPFDQAEPAQWVQFNQAGGVTVVGFVRPSEVPPNPVPLPDAPQQAWYRVDIEALQNQIPYQLLPVYIRQIPSQTGTDQPPFQAEPTFDLSDGPHLGYAIQWVLFALVLGVGYVAYVRQYNR